MLTPLEEIAAYMEEILANAYGLSQRQLTHANRLQIFARPDSFKQIGIRYTDGLETAYVLYAEGANQDFSRVEEDPVLLDAIVGVLEPVVPEKWMRKTS